MLRILSQARQKGITVIFTTPSVVQETAVGNHVAVLIIRAKAVDFRKGERTHEVVTLNCPKFVEASLGQFYKQEDIHVRQKIHQRVQARCGCLIPTAPAWDSRGIPLNSLLWFTAIERRRFRWQ